MFNPCKDHCYLLHGKRYSSECDSNCKYALFIKQMDIYKKSIELLETFLDECEKMLEPYETKTDPMQFDVIYAKKQIINDIREFIHRVKEKANNNDD